MAEPMRIGLIGCGFFAQNHLNAWRDLAGEGAVLTAVCDIDPAKAKAAAAEFGAPRWYSDVAEMLDAEKLDLVDIVTRMDTHRAIVTETLARKIPTVVQKPFAPAIEECMAMAEMAEKAGTFLAVHENFRFQQPMLRLAELVRAGTIGAPRWARLSFRTGFDVYKTQPYFLTEERLVILDVGIHILDVARVLLGEVDLVSCTTQRRNPQVRAEDTATMMLQHRSGAVSIVESTYESRRLPDAFPQTIVEIEGLSGAIFLKPDFELEITQNGTMRTETLEQPVLPWTSTPWHVAQEAVLTTCRHMLDAVRAGRDADTSASDNLKTFALVEAAYEAAATNSVVPPRRMRG
jgi:predicted dehydrogenase